MRAIRFLGLAILVFSVVVLLIEGGWPSFSSLATRALIGVIAGVLFGLAIRASIPRERRREFIRRAYPRIGDRLPPPDEDA